MTLCHGFIRMPTYKLWTSIRTLYYLSNLSMTDVCFICVGEQHTDSSISHHLPTPSKMNQKLCLDARHTSIILNQNPVNHKWKWQLQEMSRWKHISKAYLDVYLHQGYFHRSWLMFVFLSDRGITQKLRHIFMKLGRRIELGKRNILKIWDPFRLDV